MITATVAGKFLQPVKWLFSIIFVFSVWTNVASAEQITSFVSDIKLETDGSALITETITYDFGDQYKHGIYRKILEKHPQPASFWYKQRYIDYELLSVKRDGKIEPYTLPPYDGLSIKIGDPNATITGEHVYQITYKARGILAQYPEGVELYWNVNGIEWEVPILKITTIVRTDNNVKLLPNFDCYAGDKGSLVSCSDKVIDGIKTTFNQNTLYPGQQLTVAQRVSGAQIAVLEKWNDLALYASLVIIWFVFLGAWLYRWRFHYRSSRTIIPQYEPYENFKPMFTGVLFDNKLDPRDITAGIIYLAQQGFISITQTTEKAFFLFETNDYEIKLLRITDEVETKFNRHILELIFGSVYTAVGRTERLSLVKEKRSSKNYVTLKLLKKFAEDDLINLGFLEQRFKRSMRVLIIVVIWVGINFFGAFINGLILVFSIISILVVVFLGMERRTTRGFEALHHLKGFKQFLAVTEAERYKFHNAPAKNPQQFMEYLPYAIAFGVEKEWAEVFKDITIEAPTWYSGSDTFNAVAFTGDIGSFARSFAASTGSAGSSGGGSGGGGFSGGGGGGGGGGSW